MNDYQNTGNANAALMQSSFNQQDRLADEFIHCLFCLIGEDMPEALVNNYFNKEHTITQHAMLVQFRLPRGTKDLLTLKPKKFLQAKKLPTNLLKKK